MHKDEKMFVPTMIFGHLLTSSNYNDEEDKVTGGRNGYGAKLCNIFSSKFVVETACSEYKKTFKQVCKTLIKKIWVIIWELCWRTYHFMYVCKLLAIVGPGACRGYYLIYISIITYLQLGYPWITHDFNSSWVNSNITTRKWELTLFAKTFSFNWSTLFWKNGKGSLFCYFSHFE